MQERKENANACVYHIQHTGDDVFLFLFLKGGGGEGGRKHRVRVVLAGPVFRFPALNPQVGNGMTCVLSSFLFFSFFLSFLRVSFISLPCLLRIFGSVSGLVAVVVIVVIVPKKSPRRCIAQV